MWTSWRFVSTFFPFCLYLVFITEHKSSLGTSKRRARVLRPTFRGVRKRISENAELVALDVDDTALETNERGVFRIWRAWNFAHFGHWKSLKDYEMEKDFVSQLC